MIIDFRSNDPAVKASANRLAGRGYRCFVDGVEIHAAHYIDTQAGIVKSYDVTGDGKAHTKWDIDGCLPPNGELLEDVLCSVTIRGAVELRPPASEENA